MKSSRYFSIVLVSLLAMCTKDETTPRAYPRVETNEVTGITKDGAVLSGAITYLSTDVSDFGFLVSAEATPTLSNSEIVSMGSRTSIGKFAHAINWSLIENKKYYVVAYAKNSSYLVYGEIVSFTSLGSKAPQVSDFTPSTASWLDTVSIVGHNFSSQAGNVKVFFGASEATVVSESEAKIKALVPPDLAPNTYTIKVSIIGNTSSKDGFVLKNGTPGITSITPDTVIVGDIVTITGKNFSPNFASFQLNGTQILSPQITSTTATFSFPKGIQNGDVAVTGSVLSTQISYSKKLIKPLHKVTSLSANQGNYDESLIILGNYFPLDTSIVRVYFDEAKATIKQISRKQIQVQIPYFSTKLNPTIAVDVEGVRVTLNGFQLFPTSIASVAPSQHLFPGTKITIQGKNFGNNSLLKLGGKPLDKSYIVSNANTQISFYLPDTTAKVTSLSVERFGQETQSAENLTLIVSYKKKVNSFGYFFEQSTGFSIGSKNYFGFGWFYDGNSYSDSAINEFYEVDPNINSSNAISVNISPRASAFSFTINGLGYIGGGIDQGSNSFNDFYSFEPSTHSVTRLNNLPILTGGIDQIVSMFSIGDKAYCMTLSVPQNKNLLYEYDVALDQWIRKADFPGAPRRLLYGSYSNWSAVPQTFSFNGIGYLVGGVSLSVSELSDFWSYNPAQDQWTQLNLGISLSDTHAITQANGGIYLVNYSASNYTTDFYQFSETQKTFTKSSFVLKPLPFYSANYRYFSNGGFSLGGTGFLYSGSTLWEFDPSM